MARIAPFLHTRSSSRKILLFHAQVFGGRFNDEIDIRERAVIEGARDRVEARIHSGLIEPPAFHHALVILRDDAKPFVKRGLIAIEDNDRNAGIGEGHRDAAAHRPGPDDAYALDFSRLHLVGKAGNFNDLPFREKGMDEPVALPVVQSLMKQLALTLKTFAEWKLECAFDRGDAAERRMLTGVAPFDLFAFFVENG